MEEKKQEKTKKKIVFYLIPILIFVVFIGFMMIRTFTGEVKSAVTETTLSSEGFENLSDSFEDVLQENMFAKNEYINLNGLTTRILRINSLNEKIKLTNNYLADFEEAKDTESVALNLIELNDFLAERDIPFIYVLVPSKSSFYDVEFPPGYEANDTRSSITSLIDALNENGVNTIDMNDWFYENDWSMEDSFFVTDHHWLPQSAFSAARYTMEVLSEKGYAVYNEGLFDDENWTVTILKDCFLGSDGRRTGILYAGVDDIAVYEPNFETNYIYSYLQKDSTNWVYRNDALNLDYAKEIDYFNKDIFDGIYIGDYPLKKIVNTEAEMDKKVLILGDSFRNPYQYFLSTQFQEIYAIDLRYYTDGSLAQYINEIKPDIVLMCSYEKSLSTKAHYTYGVSEYLLALDGTDPNIASMDIGDISISPQNNNNNFVVLCDNLELGQTYTLTVDATSYSGGEDLYVQMTLQDLSTNQAVYNRYFDANSDESQKWIFSVPDGDDTYAIYLYAGTKGHTQNTTAGVSDIILYEGIIEN